MNKQTEKTSTMFIKLLLSINIWDQKLKHMTDNYYNDTMLSSSQNKIVFPG